jgi:uncharacterized protein YkwD
LERFLASEIKMTRAILIRCAAQRLLSMRIYSLTYYFICCALLLMPGNSLSAQPAVAPNAKAAPAIKLSRDEQRQLSGALAEFRNNRRDPAKRKAAVAKAVALGSEGASQMLLLVTAELEKPLSIYRDKFRQLAGKLYQEQLKNVSLEEVTLLRNKVLQLADQYTLTKEKIVEQADPAMKQLGTLLLVDRQTVLEKNKELLKLRDSLQELGSYWETCMVALWEQTPSDSSKPTEAEKPVTKPTYLIYLQREEELAVRLAGPLDDQARAVFEYNAKQENQMESEEYRCLLELNLMRVLLGLKPVAFDKKLMAAARDHSLDMQTIGFFAHESPVAGKTSPFDRAKNFDTTASGENIFFGSLFGTEAHLAWFHSPGHFKNQLADHTRVGIGRSERHWTQLFGR